jgi:orotidine-5'-phosphate decarboxylase
MSDQVRARVVDSASDPMLQEFDEAMQTPEVPVAVAAITALTGVLKRSQARTAMQLQTELRLNVEKVDSAARNLGFIVVFLTLFAVAPSEARRGSRIRSIRRSMRAFHAVCHADEQR